VSAADLIAPLLVQPSERDPSEYMHLPTAVHLNALPEVAADLWQLGIRAVKLFCYVADKTPDAAAALEPDNLLTSSIRIVREAVPAMVIATEVCGCAWTDTGECVLLTPDHNTNVDATMDLMSPWRCRMPRLVPTSSDRPPSSTVQWRRFGGC
jgi:porphobilinogen synthase